MGPGAGRVQSRGLRAPLSEPITTERPARAHTVLVAVVALTVLALDQLGKWWALSELDRGRVIDLFWTLRFNLTSNTGATFGLGGAYGQWIALLAVGVVGLLIWQGRTVTSRLGAVALGMVLG